MDWLGGAGRRARGVLERRGIETDPAFRRRRRRRRRNSRRRRARAAPWWRPTGPSRGRALVAFGPRNARESGPASASTSSSANEENRTAPRWRRSRTTPFCTTRFCPSSGPRCITTATDPRGDAGAPCFGSRRVVSARHSRMSRFSSFAILGASPPRDPSAVFHRSGWPSGTGRARRRRVRASGARSRRFAPGSATFAHASLAATARDPAARSRAGDSSATRPLDDPAGADGARVGRRRLVRIRGDAARSRGGAAHRRRRQRTRRRPRRTRGTRSRPTRRTRRVARPASWRRVRVRGRTRCDGDVESHVDGAADSGAVGLRAQPRTVCREKRVVLAGRASDLCRLVERYASQALRGARGMPVRTGAPCVRNAGRGRRRRSTPARARGDAAALVASFARRATCSSGSTRWAPRATRTKRTARACGKRRHGRSSNTPPTPPTPPTPTPTTPEADAPLSPRRRKPSRNGCARDSKRWRALDATLRLARQRSGGAGAGGGRPPAGTATMFAPRPFVGSRARRPRIAIVARPGRAGAGSRA